MRPYLDTNVVIAHFVATEPEHARASELLRLGIAGAFTPVMDVAQMSDIGYLMRSTKRPSPLTALQCVRATCAAVEVVGVTLADLELAESLPMADVDLEDALRCAVALREGCELIVTANSRRFEGSPVRAVSIARALASVEAQG